MKYVIDNDLHIHSKISSCSKDPEQTNERILRYAEENGLRTICLTDHFWDETVEGASNWYRPQNYKHIAAAKPLPQGTDVRFLFGCETELNKGFTLGADVVLRPYIIAKQCGCKFYCGSDAHHPNALDRAKAIFERTIDLLKLTEEDKFIISGI